MRKHTAILPPESTYPVDNWKITQTSFSDEFMGRDETMFAIGNGYIGMRGTFEEGAPYIHRGVFINGFHETWPIQYGEKAYGFAEHGQTMVDVPDAMSIKLYVDDEPLYLPTAYLKEFERSLNMHEGTLTRKMLWETPTGKLVEIKITKFVSMEFRHLVVMNYEFVVLNAPANVIVSSKIELAKSPKSEDAPDDPRKAAMTGNQVFSLVNEQLMGNRIVLGYKTKASGMTLACGKEHVIETDNEYTTSASTRKKGGKIVYNFDAQPNQKISMKVFVSYHTSRSTRPDALCDRVNRTIDRSFQAGYDKLLTGQQIFMSDFWDKSDVVIESDMPRLQQIVRFNLFHICQASARAEGTGIGARGLTGSAYDGHYFWDTEIYVLPFLLYTNPRIARNLLRFRHSILDKARERAKQLNQEGALFPWRTINGHEASAFFAAGTAQYHINADIMYALRKYVEITGDEDFLCEYGAEMLVESARLYADLGSYPNGKDGEFHIHGVTGPDEYTAIVNNNLYTNMMARDNLRYAVNVMEMLERDYPKQFERIVRITNLNMKELTAWQHAADHMYIPYDKKRKIHPQDDNFLEREMWDFDGVPEDKYPLLLHFHPLVIYRYQVIKQADVAMAMFLLGDQFTDEQKKNNFDYYDKITTGDSSLSACIQGILAMELGNLELAREYFRFTILMDYGDVGRNTADGAHIAAMGGSWMSFVYGIAGMRDIKGFVRFNPKLDEHINRLHFSLIIKGQVLDIDIKPDQTTYYLKEGNGLKFKHKNQVIEIKEHESISVLMD